MKQKRSYKRLIIIAVILVVAIACALMYLFDTKAKHATLKDEQGNVIVHTIALDAGTDLNNFDSLGLSDEIIMNDATVMELAKLLNADPNFEAVILRESNTEANLETKTNTISESGAEMVIGIQANHDSDSSIAGISIYAVPPGLGDNTNSLKLANSIIEQCNDKDHETKGIYYYYYMYERPDLYTIDIVDSTLDNEQRDSFTIGLLTANQEVPSVIINQGYLTNQEDTDYYTSEKGIKAMAKVYYEAILAYYGI